MDKDGDKKGGDKKGGQSGAGLGGAAGVPDPASLLDAASLFGKFWTVLNGVALLFWR